MRAYLLTGLCAFAVACGSKSAAPAATTPAEVEEPAAAPASAKPDAAKAPAKTQAVDEDELEEPRLDTGTPFSEDE